MSQNYRENELEAVVANSNPIETRHCECNTPIQQTVVDIQRETSALDRHENGHFVGKPSREEAESAIRTLLRWAGEDPTREGLVDTPARAVRAYEEWFKGYAEDPIDLLQRNFEEVEGYQDAIVLRNIPFVSHCEHHMAPIIGKAHIGYVPTDGVVGISKLARVVDVFACRFQVQEAMTALISNSIQNALRPKGVAVVIEAQHQCMTTRGVNKSGVTMVTSQMLGVYREDPMARSEFLTMIGNPTSSLHG